MKSPDSDSDVDRALLERLAQNRAARMVDGRPVFNLTREEAEASTRIAMRLAASSPSSSG